jgi:hypothetical protein
VSNGCLRQFFGYAVGKPTSASVTPPLRLKTFTAAGRWFFQGTPVSSTNKTGRIKLTVARIRSVLFHFNGNTSYLTTSTLNTKYIWAVLIKLHDSATYDDRRKSYEWLKPQSIKMQLISLKVYFLRNQSYRDKSANQKQ